MLNTISLVSNRGRICNKVARLFFIGYSLAFLLALGCTNVDSSDADSREKTLEKDDIKAISEVKDEYDSNVEKLFVFIVSEDHMTNQGESFWNDIRLLIKNNIGRNYSLYVMSSSDPRWLSDLSSGKDGLFPEEKVLKAQKDLRQDDIEELTSFVKIRKTQLAGAGQKLQIILHLLAHGSSSAGTGEGGIGLGGTNYSFRDIAERLLEPLAENSDEMIAIIEPCFGGSTDLNLSNDFYQKNNVMVIYGAPPWASQWVISNDNSAISNSINGKDYKRSTATIAFKKALMGAAVDPSNNSDVVFRDGETLEIFAGTGVATKLQEKHVVRVKDFKYYMENKGGLINCRYAYEHRAMALGNICKARSLGVSINFGAAINDQGAGVKVELIKLLNRDYNKEQFQAEINRLFPVHPLKVYTPTGENHSLNPEQVNGILAFVHDRDQQASSLEGGFRKYQGENLANISDLKNQCFNDLDVLHGDYLEVLKWVTSHGGTGFMQGSSGLPFEEKDDAKSGLSSHNEVSRSDNGKTPESICSKYKVIVNTRNGYDQGNP
tara:strand:+ start:1335 stop:2981 length:1647 start_codon:yes stop_codon:yes gene_type:complete